MRPTYFKVQSHINGMTLGMMTKIHRLRESRIFRGHNARPACPPGRWSLSLSKVKDINTASEYDLLHSGTRMTMNQYPNPTPPLVYVEVTYLDA